MKTDSEYSKLFLTDKDKAIAFDKVAELFYDRNFGSTSKSDLETLMFSIYMEQILKSKQKKSIDYSDYNLSKQLGITQTKISNLKERKELKYPYEDFDWRSELKEVVNRIVFDDGKVMLFIPARNVYLEIKNAIEERGGYVEERRTRNLLQVRLPYFLDLLVAINESDNREEVKAILERYVQENNIDINFSKNQSFGQVLCNAAPGLILELMSATIPVFGGVAKTIGECVLTAIKQSKQNS